MGRLSLSQLKALVLCALWLITVATLTIMAPAIFQLAMATTILQFSTILSLVALGQAFVILAGGAGIDLSIGGTVSLVTVLALMATGAGMPAPVLPLFCVAIGLLLGLLNGWMVTALKVLPLIATLGTLYVYSGLALALTGGAAQRGVPQWLVAWGRADAFGVPLPFLMITLPAFAAAAFLLGALSWGRWIYAMGHNETSARLVGIPVDYVRLMIYGAAGSLGGLAGLVALGWLGSGRPNIGQNLELESLTAALLGGIGIFGGSGGVGGVLAAVLLLVTVKAGLQFMNVNAVWQLGVVGALLIIVIVLERFARRGRG